MIPVKIRLITVSNKITIVIFFLKIPFIYD